MSSLSLPRQLNTQERRDVRALTAEEAMSWSVPLEGHADTVVYELADGVAVGVRKPGKEAAFEGSRNNPFDMLPLIFNDGRAAPFDSGFKDLFRCLFDVGTSSRRTRQEDGRLIAVQWAAPRSPIARRPCG